MLTCISRYYHMQHHDSSYFCMFVVRMDNVPVWLRAIQCGPLKVRNRSQAYTVHGQISAMRTCDGRQRVKEFQHYLVWQGLEPPFWWGRIEAWCVRSSTMRSDRGRLLYAGFRFGFGSTVRLESYQDSSQYSMSMWLSFGPPLAEWVATKWFFYYLKSILSDLVRGPTTWSNEDPFHTTNET